MENLYARSVFFVGDAGLSLQFYTDTLGFTLDWNHREAGRPFVFQVSLLGFQLILNQADQWTNDRGARGCAQRQAARCCGGRLGRAE